MKHLLFVFGLLVILFSCKKEVTLDSPSTTSLINIKTQLKDSMVASEFQQLDLEHTFITKYEKNDLTIARIPFFNKSLANDFVLLKIEKDGTFSIGKRISMAGTQTQGNLRSSNLYNGKINIYLLKGDLITESLITDGYIEAFHTVKTNPLAKDIVVEIPLMPEVVMVSSYSTGSGMWSTSSLFNLQSMMYGGVTGGGGGSSGYYNIGDPMSTPGTSGGGGGGGGYADQPVLIDYEPVENLPAIDMAKYLKCFNNIPDAGALCSIKILTDIPVDSDPTAFFNWQNGSPGHTFIQISKSNGGQTIQQNIGFYPDEAWKLVLTTDPLTGKFADNTGHEFNASLSMNLTPEKFNSTISYMQNLANVKKYDIDEYNCTDFALEVFNYQRGANQLIIPRLNIPGGDVTGGSNTPQGLYQQLKAMQEPGAIDSKNIIIPGYKGYAGNSNGPCN